MKPIDEQHIAEPGLVVLDITGGDEDTVRAVMATLEERWATPGIVPYAGTPASTVSGRGFTPTSRARGGTVRSRSAWASPPRGGLARGHLRLARPPDPTGGGHGRCRRSGSR
ncbi:DUF6207 family protein [Streptomyces sp. NPDC059982]|uniref:DUF6207 family protein n=1 Tax=unclassified Streptomyces TaxID=2593676 RepID=UPI0036A81E2E